MKLLRRKLLHLAASVAVLPAALRIALALDYPTRPVRLIVGFFAGGLTDILARLLAPWLSERLGQQFIVEDQPGAGTNLAAEAVVRAPPDGYTHEATVWNGVVAPKNTRAEIIDRLYKEIDAALVDPKIMARFTEVGSVPKSMTPADFGQFLAEDTEKWGKVIRAANIKVD